MTQNSNKFNGLQGDVPIPSNSDFNKNSAGGRLFKFMEDYRRSLDSKAILSRDVRFLMNLICLEPCEEEFEKLADKIKEYIPVLAEVGDIKLLKEITKFFSEDLIREMNKKTYVQAKAIEINKFINKEVSSDKLKELIKNASDETLQDIAYLISSMEEIQLNRIIDAFIKEEDIFVKDKYFVLFSALTDQIAAHLSAKIIKIKDNTKVVKELFKILRVIDAQEAKKISHELIHSSDVDVGLAALQLYSPGGDGYVKVLLDIIHKSNSNKMKYIAVKKIVGTREWPNIEQIFNYAGKWPGHKNILVDLIKLCGENKITKAVPYIKKVLFHELLIRNSYMDEIRIVSAVSLAGIGTEEAIGILKEGLTIRRKPVKKICENMLNAIDDSNEKR